MRTLALLFAAAVAAAAQTPDDRKVPERFQLLEKIGAVKVWVADKESLPSAARLEFLAGLRKMLDNYKALFTMDREIFSLGAGGTTEVRRLEREVDLVVFRGRSDWEEWFGKGADEPMTRHVYRYRNIIGIPLAGGEVEDQLWPQLWHEFFHVFLYNDLVTGGPCWFNEGLAEYFAYSRPGTKPDDSSTYQALAARLRTRLEKSELPVPDDLLRQRADGFDRGRMDEAWVLAHLLMTESKETVNSMIRRIWQLEQAATGREAAAREDVVRYGAWMTEEAFRGRDNLKEAFEHHWRAVLESPVHTKRLPRGIPGLKDLPAFLDIDGGFTEVIQYSTEARDGNGNLYKTRHVGRRPRGRAVYGAPWKGRLKVSVTYTTDNETWRWYPDVLDAETDEKMEPIPLKKPDEAIGGALKIRMTLIWDVKGGGFYKREKLIEYVRNDGKLDPKEDKEGGK